MGSEMCIRDSACTDIIVASRHSIAASSTRLSIALVHTLVGVGVEKARRLCIAAGSIHLAVALVNARVRIGIVVTLACTVALLLHTAFLHTGAGHCVELAASLSATGRLVSLAVALVRTEIAVGIEHTLGRALADGLRRALRTSQWSGRWGCCLLYTSPSPRDS